MKEKKGKSKSNDMDPTAPPDKDEPKDDDDESQDEDEDEDDEEDDEEAYKALLVELNGIGSGAGAPDPVETSPADDPDTNSGGEEDVVGDVLEVEAEDLLKAIEANINERTEPLRAANAALQEDVSTQKDVQIKTLELLKSVSATNKRLEERLATVENRSQGRMGVFNIFEKGGMETNMSAEDFSLKADDFMAKAVAACEQGKLSPEQVSMFTICVNKGLDMHQIMTPAEIAAVTNQN